MSVDVSPVLADAAKAIGLLDADGSLSPAWFQDPMVPLEHILTNAGQRAALLDLLDQLWPPQAPPPGAPSGKWHPLLGTQPRGNVYLTVANGAGPVTIGVAGEVHSTTSALPAALRGSLPLISVNDAGARAIAGTADAPFEAEIRVELNWTRAGGDAVDLHAMRASVVLAPLASPPARLRIVLEGLSVDGRPPRDCELDPQHLDAFAFQLVLGLLREKLRQIAGSAAGEAAALANHLMPLLGLVDGVPPFPFATLTSDPSALRTWLATLAASAQMPGWVGHLGAIFGGDAAAVGTGQPDDPWRVRIFSIDATSAVEVTLARATDTHSGTPRLDVGLRAHYVPAAANPPARIDLEAVLASIPLAGSAATSVLPSASIAVVAPGNDADELVNTPVIAVRSLRGGARWNGTAIAPQLELDDVTLTAAGASTHYDRLDLTHTDSVAAAASDAVANAIRAALGPTGAGVHLAALAGLLKPAGDPAWTHLVDATRLVSDPTGAIAAVHRAALLDAAHPWSLLFAELAALLGLPGAVTGTGTKDDPWRTTLAPGVISVEIAAWNDQTSHVAADPQQLRLGLRASVGASPWRAWWLAELLAFDLPQTGGGSVSVMAGQHASFVLQPAFAAPATAGVSLTADSVSAVMDWTPGRSMQMRAVLSSITVTAGAATVHIPSLVFPPPAGFDIADPMPTLGVALADLEALFRAAFVRGLYAWADMPGLAVAALLGLHGNLPGLQADWPTLGGNFFADPFGSLRAWLARLAVELSADGSPFLPNAAAWLAALFNGRLPASPVAAPPDPILGAGTYEDPWVLPIVRDADLLAWLEPAGPPASWAAILPARIATAGTFGDVVDAASALGTFVPDLGEAVAQREPAGLSDALDTLAAWFSATDGFVPVESQIPTGGAWTAGTPLHSAHPQQPSDPQAIAQINAQIAAWNPAQKAVLLLGPGFSDHTAWDALVAPGPGRPNFDLRVSGVDPLAVDLRGVVDAADHYTADLRDNGLAGVTAQIARVVARIGELRPGVPVTLVAHSTAGLAARAFAAANPVQARGLITLGTPHAGTPLVPLLVAEPADALRALAGLAPALPAGPLRDAVDALVRAADGYLPAPAPGQLPVPAPFSLDAFIAPGSTDTAGVPALALGGALSGNLLDEVKQALGTLATAAAGNVTPAPTHVGFGARTRLDFGASGPVGVDVLLRGDAFRVALHAGAPEPTRAAQALTVGIVLARPGGWLAGSPVSDVRVRWAELELYLAAGVMTPRARLHDAAFQSPSLSRVDVAHPQALALLGAVFHDVASPAPTGGTAVARLLTALGSLGLTGPDPRGGIGLLTDAVTALAHDPAGFLVPRLATALNAGLGGFSGLGRYTRGLGTTFEVYIDGPTIGVRTAAALPLGPIGSATVDARLSIPSLAAGLDLGLTLGAATLTYAQTTGRLTFSAPPWIDSLTLRPLPDAVELTAALDHAIPRILLSSVVSALIEAAIGPGFSIAAIDPFLESPGPSARSSGALGTDGCLDAAKITRLLQVVASATGLGAGPGLALPGNLELTASGTKTVALRLSTTAPIGGVLDLQVGANIDCSLHVTPAGTLALHVPLPGTWPAVTVTFAVDAAGVSLVVEPQGILPIRLLPTFSGLGALAGAAEALLPTALDALLAATGPSALRDSVLTVAQAFDLYDAATRFTGHAAQWRALTQGEWAAAVNTAMRTTAIPAIRGVLATITGPVATTANTVTVGAGGPFSLALGWDTGPTLSVQASGLKAADGAVSADILAGYVGGHLALSVALGVHLQSSIGVAVVPQIVIASTGGALAVKLLPLGAAGESTLSIVLAPTAAVNASADAAAALAENWLLPVAADLVVGAATPHFASPVWPGGPKLSDLLTAVGLITGGGVLASPMPAVKALVTGLLGGLASQATLAIGDLTLKFVSDATGLGLNLRGAQELPLGDVGLSLRFGNLDIPAPNPGIVLYVFRGPGELQINPRLAVTGLGIELTGPGGAPLVNNSSFRLEGAGGYVFFEFDGHLSNLGGAVEAKGVGLPLGLLGGDHDGGNPVAASLVEGAGGTSGDPHPVNPAVDVLASYIDGDFDIRIGSPSPPLWIGVHRSFGPIYIEQIGLEWTKTSADLLVDGSVKVAALTVQAYELMLNIPFRELLAPAHWSLDLRGLAVGFQSGPVSIAGGLVKNPGPPIEYDGVLSADIAGRGFTVVGGYARPRDDRGQYTSLFVFVALPIPLGGPPFLFVTGLGGGAGYNRQLQPPTDLDEIPTFFLISAIDDDTLANDPMGALVSMGRYVPPRRGSFWLAAGVRFNSFVVVNSVAVVYVALDRGFEVGILGVSHMQLPAPGIELVSIELALKLRFSAAEGILSIQAQLTDNSWLFSRDCQLTGGFAFFIWFHEGHFVLTIGGYHPSFQKPAEFPDVPRLGFHWQVLGFVQIKGEAYFAITSSAFMCGGRLEASAGFGGIRAWFTVHTDILIQWDPFHYDLDVGIEVGVSLTIEVCFFGACAHIRITISKGADLHIFGPPFHADLTFDAYVTSITLSFGGDPHPRPDPLPWEPFRDKYLVSGNPENTWVGVRVVQGLMPPDPPGAQPSPGTASDPWRLLPEFAFLTESRMPVSGYSAGGTFDAQGAVIQLPFKTKADSRVFDLAPMDKLKVGSRHSITFTPPVTHPDQFLVEEILDWVPEAAWRWYDPAQLPAAANRIRATTGLRVTGVALLQGRSALIPIATLVDDDPRYARPLPFATVLSVVGTLKTFGLTAEVLAGIMAMAGSQQTITAATAVLAGPGFFADARRSSGLPPVGIPPLAVRALATSRSAPPLLAPLTMGLSMRPVALASPPRFLRAQPVAPVLLEQPRLRAVMQSRPQPVSDAPAFLRTTARNVSVARVPRMAPPRPVVVLGARLDRIPAANAWRPTAAAVPGRTLRNPELASLAGRAHADDFETASRALQADGVVVPAGTTHVWEIPRSAITLALGGRAVAVRVTSLNRAGHVLGDTELAVSGEALFTALAGAESLAVTCLGTLPDPSLKVSPGFGAVTYAVAASGASPAVGWQTGNVVPQVGASSLLVRGAALLLRKGHVSRLNGQKTTQSMTQLSDALLAQSGAETRLPKSVDVVMILLDQQDSTAAEAGDLGIACDGATLATPPVAGAGGRRRVLLYDVVSRDEKADHITIAVASHTGWALAGVVGLPGHAAEWAARLHGVAPPRLVPDGPFTPAGEVRVRLVTTPGGVS